MSELALAPDLARGFMLGFGFAHGRLLHVADVPAAYGVLLILGVGGVVGGTWLLTAGLADRMRRAGYRGPFELLIRRVTYLRPAVVEWQDSRLERGGTS